MRVLVTGHEGYIGSVLVPMLRQSGHEVSGIDSLWFQECRFGPQPEPVPVVAPDVRDAPASALRGFDAIVHLAAISNDPLGNLNPKATLDINHRGTAILAARAKRAGVPRFVFASSCSLYGAAVTEAPLDEQAGFNPVTPYGESKVLAERSLHALADDTFSPTYLRNATAFGVSPRLRYDLVVNNLVGLAFTTGEVRLESDGTPWRPLVHVEDICRAVLVTLDAPRELVHDQAFNVGSNDHNYRIRQVAEAVEAAVPGSRVTLAAGAGPDKRSYRVAFDKLESVLPAARPLWSLEAGVEQLHRAYADAAVNIEDLKRYRRISHLERLLAERRLTATLRWRQSRA